MKLLLSITLIIVKFHGLAQLPYGNEIDGEFIKRNNVKTLTTYYLRTPLDSTLAYINHYNPMGNLISSQSFSADGKVIRSHTFIYDSNHFLIKQIDSDGTICEFVNSHNGKVLVQTCNQDSLTWRTSISYDAQGRSVKSLYYDNYGDTTTFESIYNKRGLVAKYIIRHSKSGISTMKREYNAQGKIVKISREDQLSKSISQFTYFPNESKYEYKTTGTSGGKITYSKIACKLYPNGLTFEKAFYVNKNEKLISTERTYFTYY